MTEKKKKDQEEEMAEVLAECLNKKFGGQMAYIIGNEATPTDLTDFVSTGSSLLDIAISNRLNGGIPYGRITEISGLESSGKSLVAAHMMKNVQQEGGVVVLLDSENAVNSLFWESIGLQFNKMVYAQPGSLEDVFESIETIVTKVKESSNKSKKVLVVVDSFTGFPTKEEAEGKYELEGYGTGRARLAGLALKKLISLVAKEKVALVFTNQLRQKMNAMPFSDPWTTAGGKALPYYSSVRIRLSTIGKITSKDKEVLGVSVKGQVIKNRVGPGFRSAEFNIYFDRGIDDLDSWLQYCKDKGLVTLGGAYVTYVDLQEKSHRFFGKDWKKFLSENLELKQEIYERMSSTMIMSYSSEHADVNIESAEDLE